MDEDKKAESTGAWNNHLHTKKPVSRKITKVVSCLAPRTLSILSRTPYTLYLVSHPVHSLSCLAPRTLSISSALLLFFYLYFGLIAKNGFWLQINLVRTKQTEEVCVWILFVIEVTTGSSWYFKGASLQSLKWCCNATFSNKSHLYTLKH